MRIEQNFSEADLLELEEIFSKSMEYKNPLLKKGKRIGVIWKTLLIIAIILFECRIVVIAINEKFSPMLLLYMIVGAVAFIMVVFTDMMEKKMDPKNVVKQKYGKPFAVIVNDSTLTYKQTDFLYTEIKSVMEYKNFIFIKVNKWMLIIKADKEEKDKIFSKIKENITITPVKKEEPFDLREF